MPSSYLPQEPFTFINIKLTDLGRRMLSLGQLNFASAILSDREIDYGVDRTYYYNIPCCNRVLSPKDNEPALPLYNLDGSPIVPIQSVGSALQIITAATPSTGFFSGSTNNWIINTNDDLGYSTIAYSAQTPNGNNTIKMTGGTYFPTGGELVYIPWQPIQNSGITYSNNNVVLSANPTVQLWYRVMSASTATTVVTLDRNLPNFGGPFASSTEAVNAYFYPYNGINTYYGSATTVQTKVWNLNIVRTSSVIGTSTSVSGYTTYGSLSFNGTKQYLGFSSETRQIGIIHYSNLYSGNTYAEQLVEGSVVIDMPTVMWHNYPGNPGQVASWGLELNDAVGPTIFDNIANTTYRPLMDGVSTTSNVVGRAYHKLGIMVITDPELLTALTYKSNRNYTLPPLTLGTSSVPQYPLTNSNATGLLNTGYSYYVTYVMSSNTPYVSGESFGYPATLQCEYISQISGVTDANGNPQYLTVKLANGFPYMRNSANMSSSSPFSGSGWNANMCQIMVNAINTATYPNMQIDNLPTNTWQLISTPANGGNGIFSASTTIDPANLLNQTFIISQQDYNSGSTYVLNTGITMNINVANSGLTFGNEAFFYGTISCSISSTTYKSIITILAPNNMYNSSINTSYVAGTDSTVYITSFGLLDSNNNLIAIGKPTSPIPKDSTRYLTFQLELDF